MRTNGWQSIVRPSKHSTITTSLQVFSGGLLQPYQPSIRIDHRILLSTIMSRDEGYGRVSQPILSFCKHILNALHRFEYLWQDSENYKRPTKMPAPTYIEHLMGWVQSNIDNEAVFPSRIGTWRYMSQEIPSHNFRRSLPQIISQHDPASVQAHVSCVRSHLLPSLPGHSRAWPRGSPEYKL
jgi:hypothetical protein